MSRSYSPGPAENAGPRGHRFLSCFTAPNAMLSRDLARSLRSGAKFRKPGSGLTVLPVKFCLPDFILLIPVTEDNASSYDTATSLPKNTSVVLPLIPYKGEKQILC